MEKDKRSKDESEDEDNFNINEYRATKKRAQVALQVTQRPKRNAQQLSGKKTVKYQDDPVMQNLIKSMLRQSDKFPEEANPDSQLQDSEEIQQFSPNIINGTVSNSHQCSQKERVIYDLKDEGFCLQFDINNQIRVLVIGKISYVPMEGTPVNLFVPKQISSYLQLKKEEQMKSPLPKRVRQIEDKTVIVMQRKMDQSQNILDYPYFVLDPNNLIYPTYLCSWIECKRRLALTSYVQGEKDVNENLVYGTACHRLLEWLATQVLTPSQYFQNPQETAKKLYKSMLYDMFLVSKSFDQFWGVCNVRLENLAKFYKKHIVNSQELVVEPYRKLFLKVTKMVESQIMLRSKYLGLKGKIDLLLFGQLIDRKNGTSKSVYIPMELKTGRRVSDSHKKQTDIYNILVRENKNSQTIGLLYYSDSDIKFFRYEDPLAAFEIVVIQRNRVAQNLLKTFKFEKINLPAFPQKFPQCNFCQSYDACQMSYRYFQNNQETVDLEELPSKYHQFIKEHIQKYENLEILYLSQWLKLLHKQQKQTLQSQLAVSKIGISKFKIGFQSLSFLPQNALNHKIRVELSHQCRDPYQISCFDEFYKASLKMRCLIPEISLIENCKVVETKVDPFTMIYKMTIQFNSPDIYYNSKRLSFYTEHSVDCHAEIELFSNQFFSSLRKSIFKLINNKHYIKDLLVGSYHPKQHSQSIDEQDTFSQEAFLSGLDLNKDQQKAFRMAASSTQFCLIEGMPGTGKTELIVRLVQYFSQKNLKILVTTFTNRALDNILERLKDSEKVSSSLLIREGSQYSAAPHLQSFTSQAQTFKTIEDYQKFFGKKMVWFVTLSSLYIHHLPEEFDIVILDEASQCLQPTCIEALLRAKRFVMIGDYKQLQPLVRSKEAIKQGMSLSLFQKLCIQFSTHKVSLKKQYRMNQKIMALTNQLVYQNQLQFATESTKKRILTLGKDWKDFVSSQFQQVIDPKNSIVFINYDSVTNSLSKKHASKEHSIRKVIETQLPAFVANIFRKLGVLSPSLAIITLMNISVNRISEQLKCQGYRSNSVLTIDKSQGIDREVVIVLIERGNEQLVENPRRLNVALTRAKSKLIVVGSESHLEQMAVWNGSLARLLKFYQTDLTIPMIQDMISSASEESMIT